MSLNAVLAGRPAHGSRAERLHPALLRSLTLWLLTRTVLIFVLLRPAEFGSLGDIATYYDWARAAWLDGVVPGRDFAWEYPPGALPFVLLPVVSSGPWSYLVAFSAVLLVLDAGMLLLLSRVARKLGSNLGVGLWLVAPVLLGPVFLERFDLVPAALAALAVVLAATTPACAAALLVAGAFVKVWPIALLPVLLVAARRPLSVVSGSVAAAAGFAALAASAGVFPALSSTFDQQRHRGLQVESIAAVPFLWAGRAGGSRPRYQHGAWEVTTAGSAGVGSVVSLVGLIVIICFCAWLRYGVLRGGHFDLSVAASAVVSVLVVTNKALSPQYLVWLIALVAVAACHRFAHRAQIVASLVVACALTHLVYPLLYTSLLKGDLLPLLVLSGRNALLLVLAALLILASAPSPSPTDA